MFAAIPSVIRGDALARNKQCRANSQVRFADEQNVVRLAHQIAALNTQYPVAVVYGIGPMRRTEEPPLIEVEFSNFLQWHVPVANLKQRRSKI